MKTSPKTSSNTKSCILESAARLFSKLGLEKTSTRDISKDSKTNISMISYHFGGKEGLYIEVIKEFAHQVKNKADQQIKEFKSLPMTKELFIKEVHQIVDHIIEIRTQHPEISIILAREKIEGMPLSRQIHEDIFYPLIQNFFEMFKLAQKKKIVRKDLNPALFFILLTEGVWGFYEIMDCQTSIRKDCKDLLNHQQNLKKQVTDIFLTGALV